jgi:hypothetical protein
MALVSDPAVARSGTSSRSATDDDEIYLNLLGSLVIALLFAGGLTAAGRASAVALLVAVAVGQALAGLAWVFGTGLPGRIGALVILTAAAAGADVCVSVWPHSRLGTLLAVCGLAIPASFVHQLARSAARVRVADSLGAIAFGVLVVVALPALVQLRHEFSSSGNGGTVAAGVAAAAGAALVVGFLVDMVMPAPRFDPTVPRGLLAVIASAGVGGSVGQLTLHSGTGFLDGRGAFVGAAVGALAAFFAIAVAFIERSTPAVTSRGGRLARAALSAAVPVALLAPVAFLLCLAVRA